MDDNNLSCEPMDVDLSAHSASVMDISYCSNVDLSIVKTEPQEPEIFVTESCSFSELNPETINKIVRSSMENRSALLIRSDSKFQATLLLSLLLLVISVLTHQLVTFNCCENLNIEILRKNLKTKIYGQNDAVNGIINALESQESRKMLLFYGGTGVGKTFTTSLMLENVIYHKNIYHYTMPSFLQSFSSEFMLGLTFCKSSIFVVDDITQEDMMNIKPVVNNLILKSKALSKNITIILVYNCDIVSEDFVRKCDDSFSTELSLSMENLDIKKYFIKFNTLTQEHLRNCIEDELADRKISVKNINMIEKNFNVTLDGCKGVHQKLQYLKML